ncbi:selenocysteine lyase isoform X2 [Vulpes lagopus]|uniref:selenocysteine lyase isoform X2 n=1 Tax=Vulpes lagopus TaxID=494514 RepID=UPI001BC9B67F|nr:selenocysteine lyase isoform X2 [Vulpes lagopus]
MEAAAAAGRDARGRAASHPRGPGEKSPPDRKVYMDYNATTPLEPEVIQAMTEAMREAWGNPSSPYPAGRKAKDIIDTARENIAKMIGGKPQDIIFTSGGTESNNLVIHSVVKHFHRTHASEGTRAEPSGPLAGAVPHLITCTVEHDSIRLPLEHLLEEQVAAVTFVPVSKVNGQVEVEDILAAVRPATCLVTIMLANNETGVIMPISEISQRIKALNQKRAASGLPVILLHTDAAQALGKQRVDVEDLGVDFLTIVGHKFYGPRIGALYIRGLGELTPLYPMLFGGGQERNFRPGTENTPMIAGLGKPIPQRLYRVARPWGDRVHEPNKRTDVRRSLQLCRHPRGVILRSVEGPAGLRLLAAGRPPGTIPASSAQLVPGGTRPGLRLHQQPVLRAGPDPSFEGPRCLTFCLGPRMHLLPGSPHPSRCLPPPRTSLGNLGGAHLVLGPCTWQATSQSHLYNIWGLHLVCLRGCGLWAGTPAMVPSILCTAS